MYICMYRDWKKSCFEIHSFSIISIFQCISICVYIYENIQFLITKIRICIRNLWITMFIIIIELSNKIKKLNYFTNNWSLCIFDFFISDINYHIIIIIIFFICYYLLYILKIKRKKIKELLIKIFSTKSFIFN